LVEKYTPPLVGSTAKSRLEGMKGSVELGATRQFYTADGSWHLMVVLVFWPTHQRELLDSTILQ
jgi:hypothetical protein